MDLAILGSLLKTKAAVRLIDKIEKAGAYFLPSKDIKDTPKKAYMTIIDEIAQREDINPIERMAIITSHKKIVREYINQTDILTIALENLKPNAKPEEVEDDWLNDFFDKARLISDDQMKVLWGRILAEEVNESGRISKQLLHILSVMGKRDAEIFKRLLPFCFYKMTTDGAFPTLVIFSPRESSIYADYGITYYDLVKCQQLGLLSVSGNGISIFMESIKFNYGEIEFTLKCTKDVKKIDVGTVILTDEARSLIRIFDKEYHNDIFDFNIKRWERMPDIQVIK